MADCGTSTGQGQDEHETYFQFRKYENSQKKKMMRTFQKDIETSQSDSQRPQLGQFEQQEK